MSTYLDLQNNIATDLTRTDLTAQIKSAILDAVKFYATDRFWFNVTRSMTFPTVAGRAAYGVADLAQIPNIISLDRLFVIDGGSAYPLDRNEADEFEPLISQPGAGKPSDYTRIDDQIILWPTPAAVYTMRPLMHYRLAPLSNDADSNAWTNDAEQLIRAHAKMVLYMNVIEDEAGAARMQGEIPAYKQKLDYETSARMSTGKIKSTDF